jgi:hypothetical protein
MKELQKYSVSVDRLSGRMRLVPEGRPAALLHRSLKWNRLVRLQLPLSNQPLEAVIIARLVSSGIPRLIQD